MSDQMIIEYGKGKGFHQQTLDRWLKWDEGGREALFDLAVALKLGENHLRDFMDWLEEISLRDGVTIPEILSGEPILRISSDPRLGRSDKLKRIKDQVRRLRFPRLSQIQDEIEEKIQALKLHPQIEVSVPPGLEGDTLRVGIEASSHEELKLLVGKLAEAVEKRTVGEIFDLLMGRPVENGGGQESQTPRKLFLRSRRVDAKI